MFDNVMTDRSITIMTCLVMTFDNNNTGYMCSHDSALDNHHNGDSGCCSWRILLHGTAAAVLSVVS